MNDPVKGFDGIIPVNKPRGPTSHDIVAMLRKHLGMKKIGHTGTLDPLAEGLLLCCTGKCTRLSRFFMSLNKEYLAVARFGASTDTMDSEGYFTHGISDVVLDRGRLNDICRDLVGEIEQTPPMFSAVKMNGKPLYRLARKGKSVDRIPRLVRIYGLTLISVEDYRAFLKIRCSSGTYIRSLIDDIGKQIGPGAYLESLTRTSIGPFKLHNSFTPEQMKKLGFEKIAMVPEEAMSFLPAFMLTASERKRFNHGLSIEFDSARYRAPFLPRDTETAKKGEVGTGSNQQSVISVLSENNTFLGIGSRSGLSTIKPMVVFRSGNGET